jgi:hypothetical protein
LAGFQASLLLVLGAWVFLVALGLVCSLQSCVQALYLFYKASGIVETLWEKAVFLPCGGTFFKVAYIG